MITPPSSERAENGKSLSSFYSIQMDVADLSIQLSHLKFGLFILMNLKCIYDFKKGREDAQFSPC